MKKSIYSYDTQKDCAYCRYNEGTLQVECLKHSQKQPCEDFSYDVFKRVPKKSPRLQSFDKSEFEL